MVDWSLVFSITAIVISLATLIYVRKSVILKEREIQRMKILQELQMYSDIHLSNRWNWLPNDVSIRNPDHLEFNEVIQRFVSYSEFVDPKIQDTYRYVVSKFNSGYKDLERDEVRRKYQEIREFSKNKAMELGERLREL